MWVYLFLNYLNWFVREIFIVFVCMLMRIFLRSFLFVVSLLIYLILGFFGFFLILYLCGVIVIVNFNKVAFELKFIVCDDLF